MKFLIPFFFILLFTAPSFSQSDLIPVNNGDKWGFQNKEGKIIIACKYNEASEFRNGLAKVSLNEQIGFINASGKEIIPLKYYWALNFSEGYASVAVQKIISGDTVVLYSFIDSTGKEIIDFKYDFINNFENGFAHVVLNKKCGFINTKGEIVIPLNYEIVDGSFPGHWFSCGVALMQKGDYMGLVDISGKELTEFVYEKPYQKFLLDDIKNSGIINLQHMPSYKCGYIELATGKPITPFKYRSAKSFKNGKGFVDIDIKKGFVDKTGKEYLYDDALIDDKNTFAKVKLNEKWAYQKNLEKELTPFKYDEANLFSEGCAIVGIEKIISSKKTMYYTFIDSTGKEITDFKYQSLAKFENGLSLAQLNGKYGFLNYKGEIVIPFSYDGGFNFKGNYTLMKKGNDWGIIDKTGKEITAFKFQPRVGKEMKYCPVYISLEVNGKCGLVEMATGKEITEFKYDWVEVFKSGNTGIYGANISLNGKSGNIDIEGNEYLYASNSTSGWLIHKGKWGYVISEGKYLTPFKYDTATEFKNYYAEVCINKKWGMIDTSGKEVLPCKYDVVSKWEEKFTTVLLDGKCAIVNSKWKEITPFKYKTIGSFSEGYANVAISKNSSDQSGYWYSIIDTSGKEVLPFEYDLIEDFHGGLALAEKNKKFEFINVNGETKISDFEKHYNLEPGIYLIYKNGKWGVVANGKKTTEIKYDPEVENYEGEVEVFKLKEGRIAFRINNKYGFVDVATGKEITPFKYDSVREFYDGKAEVTLKGKIGYIDKTGKEFFEE